MMHTPATPNTPTPQDLNLDAVNLDVFGPRLTPSKDLESYAVLLRVFYVTVISQTPIAHIQQRHLYDITSFPLRLNVISLP